MSIQRLPRFARPRLALRRAGAFALVLTLAGAAAARTPVWPPPPTTPQPTGELAAPRAVYQVEIDASYDPASRSIVGRQQLRWQNTTGEAVGELVFHLYLNAFAHPATTLLRAYGDDGMGPGDRGWIVIDRLQLAGAGDLTERGRFIQPDDGNRDDRTLVRFPLPEPVLPGGRVLLTLDFTARMPTPLLRNGALGDYVMAAQWYPKIAVFEDAGMRGRERAGWAAHQYHADGEFYADFGDYRVTLTLPRRYRGKIAATGRLIDQHDAGDLTTVRFEAEGVHDFAWAADPRFLVIRRQFSPQRVDPELRRRTAALLRLPQERIAGEIEPVEMSLFLQPAHSGQQGRYLDAAAAAFGQLGLELGPYPYGEIDLVDPPLGAYATAGMEYPGLVTLGTHPLAAVPPLRRLPLPEIVTVHEVIHQYFQGMVASHESEEAWLDEGITSYFEARIFDRATGGRAYRLPGGLAISLRRLKQLQLLSGEPHFDDPMVVPAWRARGHSSYGESAYTRPAVTLDHLEGLLGESEMARALRSYYRRWRFRHPGSGDFIASVEASSGRDLDRFFRQALFSSRRLSYAVTRLEVLPAPAPSAAGDRRERWLSVIEVERQGEFRHPVTVELTLSDGRTTRRRWDGVARWVRWRLTGEGWVTAVTIDPERRLALDSARLDDGRSLYRDRRPAALIGGRWLHWLQTALETAAGLLL